MSERPCFDGADISLTIDVIGDDFCRISGAASPRGQTSDNFSVGTIEIPEPATGLILMAGLAALIGTRCQQR